jgi:hypothetical protein
MEISNDIKLILGIIASILALAYAVPYIIDIIKGKTQPHLYSWFVWTLLQVVGSFAHFSHGGGYGSWSLAVGAFCCFVIFLLSFKYGTKNITRFDFICLTLSILTIFLYFGIQNAILAVIAIVIVDCIAFLPTMRKGYEEPYTETVSAFQILALSNFISLFALQTYSFITVFYTLVLLFTNTFMILILLYRRNKVAK